MRRKKILPNRKYVKNINNENYEFSEKTLDKINEWINNSDNKAISVLGFSGVIFTIFFTTNAIYPLVEFFKMALSNTGFLKFIYLFILASNIFCVLKIILGVYHLILSIFAHININEFDNMGIITDSLIFFGSISKIDFDEFKFRYNNLNSKDIQEELISQIYINSKIASNKFSNYNKGLHDLIVGLSSMLVLLTIAFLIVSF